MRTVTKQQCHLLEQRPHQCSDAGSDAGSDDWPADFHSTSTSICIPSLRIRETLKQTINGHMVCNIHIGAGGLP